MHLQSNIDLKRHHDLTIAEVKACPLFTNLKDDEAQEVIDTLKRFTAIVYTSIQSDKKVNNFLSDEQQKLLP